MRRNATFWDKFWRDRRGKVVIYQTPNRYLIGWAILAAVSLFTNGTLANVLWYLSLALLAVWAALEIWQGANYFRRCLGAVMAILIVVMLFRLI